MSIQAGGSKIALQLTKALGLEKLEVIGFDLHVHSDDVITVSVEYYLNTDQLNKAELVLKKYELELGKEIKRKDETSPKKD